jgi:hypothetical protein
VALTLPDVVNETVEMLVPIWFSNRTFLVPQRPILTAPVGFGRAPPYGSGAAPDLEY